MVKSSIRMVLLLDYMVYELDWTARCILVVEGGGGVVAVREGVR